MSVFSVLKRFRKSAFVVCVVVAAYGAYLLYAKVLNPVDTSIKYALTNPSFGDIVKTVTGNGNVSSVTERPVQSKVAGQLKTLKIKDGQAVRAGDVLAVIDQTTANQNLRDARIALAGAKLSYDKLTEPADAATKLSAQNAVDQAEQQTNTAQASLASAYDGSFNAMTSAFADIPSAVSGVHTIVHDTALSGYG